MKRAFSIECPATSIRSFTRNWQCPDQQNVIGETLEITRRTSEGREALQRFDAVADANAHFEKNYG